MATPSTRVSRDVKRVGAEARILYVARAPADWLHSAYRQSLVKGRGGPIETFLNSDGTFNEKRAVFADGMRNMDARGFRPLNLRSLR